MAVADTCADGAVLPHFNVRGRRGRSNIDASL
jgi:hypothetical protein